MQNYIQIHPADNVAVALHPLNVGLTIGLSGLVFQLQTSVPEGHKFTLRPLSAGEQVIKYGFPIGRTRHAMARGVLIDHRDIETNLERNSSTTVTHPFTVSEKNNSPSSAESFFYGYLRSDGQVGIRNDIWVIPTVGCVNGVCRQIVECARREIHVQESGITLQESGVEIHYFPHNYGCSQLSEDFEYTRRILRDMVHHPNAGGILVVGLGCENNQPHDFEAFCGNYDRERVRFMVCQEVEGDEVETGVSLVRELYGQAQTYRRTPQSLSKLRIGLKCGGSDGLSGITANPLLGRFSDWLCNEQGGVSVLTEVPEMFGAEEMLLPRCINEEVRQQAIDLIENFKTYYRSHGEPVGENPSPGNKAGGISTLEEKALGCTQKGGTSPINGVLAYGERLSVTAHGLHLLQAPGNDLVASSALAAAGCQLVLFTTGRGTPFATFVPTLKVATNTTLFRRKPHWMDFNAGVLVEGLTMDDTLDAFRQLILHITNGQLVCAEKNGTSEMAIWKDGVTL